MYCHGVALKVYGTSLRSGEPNKEDRGSWGWEPHESPYFHVRAQRVDSEKESSVFVTRSMACHPLLVMSTFGVVLRVTCNSLRQSLLLSRFAVGVRLAVG